MHTSSDLPLNPPFQSALDRVKKPSFRTARRWARCRWPAAAPAGGCFPASTSSPPRSRWPLVATLSGAAVFPALPVAPLVLVVVYSFLGVYGANPSEERALPAPTASAGR